MSVLTTLPVCVCVQANVIAFLVPIQQGQGHECSVIATGTASVKHWWWTTAGYHYWNLQTAVWANELFLRKTFRAWVYFLAERIILRVAGVVDNRARRRPRRG